jgi:hypothetical protein
MTSVRAATVVFLLLVGAFILLLVSSASSLPPIVASHFNIHGDADASLPASRYLAVFGALGLSLPLLIVAAFYFVRWLPPRLINLPKRDFWLAPERAADTHRYLLIQGIWFACMMLVFMFVLHCAVVRANQLTPPHLPPKTVFPLMGLFLVSLVIWTANFLRHFIRLPGH